MSVQIQAPQGTNRSFSDYYVQDNDGLLQSALSQPMKKSETLSTEEAKSWAEAYRISFDVGYRTVKKVPAMDGIMLNPPQHFQYQPLDHDQPSIRLVHLLPELPPEGLLQCRISHASTNSSYVCLSYVWDVPPPDHNAPPRKPNNRVILVDDRPFRIRSNSFDFLWTARYNATRRQ